MVALAFSSASEKGVVDMDYQDQLLDATNRHLLEQMLQDYREGKETDEKLAAMLQTC